MMHPPSSPIFFFPSAVSQKDMMSVCSQVLITWPYKTCRHLMFFCPSQAVFARRGLSVGQLRDVLLAVLAHRPPTLGWEREYLCVYMCEWKIKKQPARCTVCHQVLVPSSGNKSGLMINHRMYLHSVITSVSKFYEAVWSVQQSIFYKRLLM